MRFNPEADRLLQSYDAVADLALSEGFYQAIWEITIAWLLPTMRYARGNFHRNRMSIRTPFTGAVPNANRVTLHLEAAPTTLSRRIRYRYDAPRASRTWALNNWLVAVSRLSTRCAAWCLSRAHPACSMSTEGITCCSSGFIRPARPPC